MQALVDFFRPRGSTSGHICDIRDIVFSQLGVECCRDTLLMSSSLATFDSFCRLLVEHRHLTPVSEELWLPFHSVTRVRSVSSGMTLFEYAMTADVAHVHLVERIARALDLHALSERELRILLCGQFISARLAQQTRRGLAWRSSNKTKYRTRSAHVAIVILRRMRNRRSGFVNAGDFNDLCITYAGVTSTTLLHMAIGMDRKHTYLRYLVSIGNYELVERLDVLQSYIRWRDSLSLVAVRKVITILLDGEEITPQFIEWCKIHAQPVLMILYLDSALPRCVCDDDVARSIISNVPKYTHRDSASMFVVDLWRADSGINRLVDFVKHATVIEHDELSRDEILVVIGQCSLNETHPEYNPNEPTYACMHMLDTCQCTAWRCNTPAYHTRAWIRAHD